MVLRGGKAMRERTVRRQRDANARYLRNCLFPPSHHQHPLVTVWQGLALPRVLIDDGYMCIIHPNKAVYRTEVCLENVQARPLYTAQLTCDRSTVPCEWI